MGPLITVVLTCPSSAALEPVKADAPCTLSPAGQGFQGVQDGWDLLLSFTCVGWQTRVRGLESDPRPWSSYCRLSKAPSVKESAPEVDVLRME